MGAFNKYGAIKQECDLGHIHDSKKEAGRCADLSALQACGKITHLEQQPSFPIVINGAAVCTYRADFSYRMADSSILVTEDVKGMTTPVFNLKKKLVEASYPGTVIAIWPAKKRKARKPRKKAA